MLRTGSSISATGSSQPTVHQDSAPAPYRRNTRSTTPVSATLPSVSNVPATAIGMSESGDSAAAAIGG